MRNRRKCIFFVVSLTVVCACGRRQDDTASEDEVETIAPGSLAIVSDSTLAAEAINSQVDEAISDAASDVDSESATQTLTNSETKKDLVNERSCEAGNSGVTVKIKRGYTVEREHTGAVRTVTTKLSVNGEHERQWSKADTTLACNAAKTHVALAGVAMTGVKLTQKFSRERTQSFSASNKRTGKSVETSRKFSAEGTRLIEWTAENTTATEISRDKTVSNKVTRTLEAKNGAGKTVSLKSEIYNKEDAPLKVTVVRDATSKVWTSKTIVSGTSIAKHADGSRVEQVFNNVKFTSSEKCAAVSGSIAGSVYESADASTAKQTFAISFADGVATITFSDGTQKELTQEGCDLENSNEEVE